MGYYVSPRFLDKLAVHITKNFIDFPGVRVPLILGVHGRKGEGKSFQCELVFQKMGIEPVRMSAGELESPDAGDPVRLIRMRYREAAELVRVRGSMCVLLINDLDAGAGRVDQTTQYTVNTQLVNGTLMNIADNPTDVQLPGSYETEPIQRVPIIVTGNDFSTLYAPLVRDGRMEKFYWEPTRDDRLGIVSGIFEKDGLSQGSVAQLVDHFSNQSIDFFGALRSRLYDEQVRRFIEQVGLARVSTHLINSTQSSFPFQNINASLSHLIELGQFMAQETQRLQEMQLAKDYTKGSTNSQSSNSQSFNSPSSNSQSSNSQSFNSQSSNSQSFNSQSTPRQPVAYPPTASQTTQYLKEKEVAPTVQLPDNIHQRKIVEAIDRALLQGGKIRLEVASRREKAANIWRTWTWPAPPANSTQALEGIQTCLQEHPQSFIKLIGYNSQTQTRLMEELIVRPS